jgi:hypothetical protein
MRRTLLLTAAALIASPIFAQSSRPIDTERPPAPVTQAANSAPTNYRFHAQFGGCCVSGFDFSGGGSNTYASNAAPQSYGSAHAAGGPDFQPSRYEPFPDAVAAGEEQASNSPFAQSKDATVQQMLDLVQATHAAAQQEYDEGDSAPVKWADLKPGINPADYQKPPSTYMKYKDALALGKEQAEEEAQQPPSLGEVAAEAKDARPAGEKPVAVIKQDSKGAAVVVHKNVPAGQQQQQEQPAPNSQPQ